MGKTDCLQLTLTCELNGKVMGKKITYDRAIGVTLFDIEDVLRLSFFIEYYANVSGTSLDFLIDEIAEHFGVTPEQKSELIERYWHKRNRTIKSIVDGWKDIDFQIYKSSENFIKHLSQKAIRDFQHYPIEIKKGLLYAIWKYFENESLENINKDINELPDFFKTAFDNCFQNDAKATNNQRPIGNQ